MENRNVLRGKENDIISEILKTGSFKNTLLTYFIILLYNKMEKKDIFGFLKENYIEVSRFYNELKENVGKIEFEEILKTSKIPREETFLFSEYFNHFEFVSIDNFKEQLLSSNNNKKKYPLLWSYITDENVKNLKYLLDYNDFVNFMKNNYSGKISRKDAKDVNLSEKEIYQNREFQKKLDKFKYIFNEILFFEEKDKINENDKLACFLIDDIKNENGIKIKKGIKWQNSFLKPIIESKGNINLNYYKSSLKLETDVQKVNKSKIILIDECFKNTPFVNFRGLITLYSKNHDQDKNKFDYDFEKIEEELSKILLPQKCLFNEKNFDYVIYQFESANTNNDYLINFQKKYGAENLDENDKKTLYKYFKENYNYYSIFDEQFIILLNYLANNSKKLKEDSIYDCIIETKKKPVNFHNIFESFFSKEGKEITISKLLESINYIELLCFDKLKNKLKDKYKKTLDKKLENDIINYFEKEHLDKVITKKDIAIALRKFILKNLIDEKKEPHITPISLHKNLCRKDLWEIKIFITYQNYDDFQGKIKEYINRFSLKTNDSLGFYNIIGKEEMDQLEKEKIDFKDVEEQKPNNLIENLQINLPNNNEVKKSKGKKKKNQNEG